jgi:hypothetical protein
MVAVKVIKLFELILSKNLSIQIWIVILLSIVSAMAAPVVKYGGFGGFMNHHDAPRYKHTRFKHLHRRLNSSHH